MIKEEIKKINEIITKRNLNDCGMGEPITTEEEKELYERIKNLEKRNIKGREFPYILTLHERGYAIVDNPRCGTDQATGTPISTGKTPKKAIKKAFEMWGVPPVFILNAKQYCKEIYNIENLIREL